MARFVSLQRKCINLKEHLHDNPSHSSGEVHIILEVCLFEGLVEQVLHNARYFFQIDGMYREFLPESRLIAWVMQHTDSTQFPYFVIQLQLNLLMQ